ncbi:hypothetical protein ACJMK2_008112 [Sinanodonta woodiana]|uniref:XK-related protein n=1 Tax=Sinanodonta woodiana TaxID=1069815 RepID=A0ABD3VNU9_SINWO
MLSQCGNKSNLGGITPASTMEVLDKDEIKDNGFDFDEHSVECIDYKNKYVNKENFCSRGNADTNTNINCKVQPAKKVDESHVEVETFIQGDLAEENWKDERKAKIVKFDAVKNEQTILSAAERLLTDQGANTKKKRAEINDDRNINEELDNHRDYADAPFGTRERPSSPFNKYRKSLTDEPPCALKYNNSDNGSMEHKEDDVINGCVNYNNSNDDIDLYKYSEGTILNGNKFKIFRHSVRRLERPLTVFVVAMSVLLFMADIVTDCLLAGEYYTEAKMGLFSATVVLIIGPAVIMSVVDLSWLYSDIKKRPSARSNGWTNIKWILTLRVLLGVFSFGRIVRIFLHYDVRKSIVFHGRRLLNICYKLNNIVVCNFFGPLIKIFQHLITMLVIYTWSHQI